MHSAETLYLIALCGTILGIAAGYLLSKWKAPSALKQQQLQQELEALQQQQQQYQQQVANHFSETAELVNTMTDSYRNVHEHLAAGAQLLAAEHSDTALTALDSNSTERNGPLVIEQGLSAVETEQPDVTSPTASDPTTPDKSPPAAPAQLLQPGDGADAPAVDSVAPPDYQQQSNRPAPTPVKTEP